METTSTVAAGPDAAQAIRDAIGPRQVCPFCGAVREQIEGPCPKCSMENTSASRQATKVRIGPWYVFQNRNPAAPGMKFETLITFVRKGRVKARSVVRGPTTHQLWRFAAHVKGLSREFGICYSCGGSVKRTEVLCSHCNRSQEPPGNPDVFLEGQDGEAPAQASTKSSGPSPLPSEDVVAPAMGFDRTAPSSFDPLDGTSTEDRLAKKGGDGYLSPQDLAAAFNLDFRPKGKQAAQTQSQMNDPFGQPRFYAARPKPRGKRRWGRTLFLLLLLGAIAGVAYAMYTKPLLRAQTIDYANRGMTWTKQKWSRFKTSSIKSPSSTSVQQPLITTPSDPWPQPPTTRPSTETTRPTPTQGKSNPWDQIYDPQSSAAKKVTPKTADTSAPGTVDEARTLYWAAIDAEAQGDFATAVKKYEQIKLLPQDLWPKDLNLRLDQAKKQVRP